MISADEKRARLLARMRPYAGIFLHGVALSDPVACHNFGIMGQIRSSEYTAVVDPSLWEGHRSPRDVPIEELRRRPPETVYQPFAAWRVHAAAIIRNGGHVGIGTPHTQWCSAEQEQHILNGGDIELAFETGRRDVAPEAASRLTSVYVAENNHAGRQTLSGMFPARTDIHILKARIPIALRVTRVDARWYADYWQTHNKLNIQMYWRGLPRSEREPSHWEYLVEGLIESIDEGQLSRIHETGVVAGTNEMHERWLARPRDTLEDLLIKWHEDRPSS